MRLVSLQRSSLLDLTVLTIPIPGLPGDLAEVAVYQGPRLRGDLYIGPAGTWNDTVIPRVRYMDQRNHGLWQMTDAEAIGGIDGRH